MVKESSTIAMSEWEEDNLAMSLPYVEVASDRTFHLHELHEIWFDKDRIYLLKKQLGEG